MSDYLYLIRAKHQFAQHTLELLQKQSGIRTIEKLHVEQDDEKKGTIYDDNHYRVNRPFQHHVLFIVRTDFYQEKDKKAFDTFIERGIEFELIFQVNAYEIDNEERWK